MQSSLQIKPETVLVLGSGALQIAQAGEFDYSGSQALKALREDRVRSILINPNIATIQTSAELADEVYLLPVDARTVDEVIARERVTGILLGFGGQTALNCGLELAAHGVLERHGVRVLGTSIDSIRAAEDRQVFAEKLGQIAVDVARSQAASTVDEALRAAHEIGLPVILRAAFSLGGRGSAIVRTENELVPAITRAFAGNRQVLVEECLAGWKEIEYEVLRDREDNAITICNMENVDPMGIHTGESIVVAPSQTLDDNEYQHLREIALRIARHFQIVGECNVQFALDPTSRRYRVIEINPRLSRSSALASKATGYPIAYIAAKVALGHTLPVLRNPVTKTTSAFFEPALDYVVCKMPRWDFEKFAGADPVIGTEMKSVGEVMSIGRSFPEALQKAIRMLEIGATGLDGSSADSGDVVAELARPSARRIFAIARAFRDGMSIDAVAAATAIDRFFLAEIERIARATLALQQRGALAELDREFLEALKRDGFSDRAIATAVGATERDVRARRLQLGITPRLARIDTLAAEYPAVTNYLYLTYGASTHDVPVSSGRKILILGSGPYRIGSSVEFDWCCVQAAVTARELGFETLVMNCNPETVSTDFDRCDRLIFDELTVEAILEVCSREQPEGIIVSMGGQTPNNLALKLSDAGLRILGTDPSSIDRAEDRNKFSTLCDGLGIDQPRWTIVCNEHDLDPLIERIGGFPVIVRPSYVLSGAAMRIAYSGPELRSYLAHATRVSPEHPIVISKFERHARELEYDAVADRGEIVQWAIAEHIEDAGVHSGDATLVIPPQQLTVETVNRARRIGARLARALNVSGPFNVQLLARDNEVKVIECNLRASRSLPFVSKALGTNFASLATRLMLDDKRSPVAPVNPLDLDYVAVKAPQFSFRRLTGADPLTGVEMLSTGEVGCFGDELGEALMKSLLATGFHYPARGVLLSLGPVGDKYRFSDEARLLTGLGLPLFATPGTADMLRAEGISCVRLEKQPSADGAAPEAVRRMASNDIDLVINIPREYDQKGRPDGYFIRRAAIDLEIPLITDLALARQVVRALTRFTRQDLKCLPMSHYLRGGT